MSVETREAKARRYLVEGHVRIVSASPTSALAHVRGSQEGDPYDVVFQDGVWVCDCPARIPSCAHVIAVRLVCNPVEPVKAETTEAMTKMLSELLGGA